MATFKFTYTNSRGNTTHCWTNGETYIARESQPGRYNKLIVHYVSRAKFKEYYRQYQEQCVTAN